MADVGVLGEKEDDNVDCPSGALLGGLIVDGVTALEGSEAGENVDGVTDKGVYLETEPESRLTTFRTISFLEEKNSSADRLGSRLGAGGKMSAWKESALRGTTNATGSIVPDNPEVVILYARAISHSETLRARRGRKHIPR